VEEKADSIVVVWFQVRKEWKYYSFLQRVVAEKNYCHIARASVVDTKVWIDTSLHRFL